LLIWLNPYITDVDFILSKCPLKMQGRMLELQRPERPEESKPEKVEEEADFYDAVEEVAFDGTQTKVLIEDIPAAVDEEQLETFLESKKCKRCNVASIDFDAEDRNAVVEFESPEGKASCQAGINFWFPLNNLSLIWPIDTKHAVWVAYIKTQRGIATHVSVIKVKVTVTKNRNSVSAQ